MATASTLSYTCSNGLGPRLVRFTRSLGSGSGIDLDFQP